MINNWPMLILHLIRPHLTYSSYPNPFNLEKQRLHGIFNPRGRSDICESLSIITLASCTIVHMVIGYYFHVIWRI